MDETDTQYKISIDFPGYSQKEIEINLENNILNIIASNEKRGKIERYLILRNNVDNENITAKMTNGVLEILINKINKRKKIDIQ